jgi:hypothetical protein
VERSGMKWGKVEKTVDNVSRSTSQVYINDLVRPTTSTQNLEAIAYESRRNVALKGANA